MNRLAYLFLKLQNYFMNKAYPSKFKSDDISEIQNIIESYKYPKVTYYYSSIEENDKFDFYNK